MLDPDAAVAGPSPIRDFLEVLRGTHLAAMLCYVSLAHCQPTCTCRPDAVLNDSML